ncbi:hypothetical protein MP228_004656 [Amoeboaphelidium protococcarum]|nr:hypothetical protein MP228_004656 [Amoeboaphelidium protococcarum]
MPAVKRNKKSPSPQSKDALPTNNGVQNGSRASLLSDSQRAPNVFWFTDLTPNCTILWVSPSCYDLLGFREEEMVGKSGYAFVHPDDIEVTEKNHMFNLTESVIARIMTMRWLFKEKDGQLRYKLLDMAVNFCYDCLVVIGALHEYNQNSIAFRQSAEDLVRINACGSTIENWMSREKTVMRLLSDTLTWESSVSSTKEPRVCLILNRFTNKATIQFATMGAKEVLQSDDHELIGKSFLDFIADSADDTLHGIKSLDRVKSEIDFVRSSGNIHHLNFTWRNIGTTWSMIECEAIITSTWDGLVCVIRRKQ